MSIAPSRFDMVAVEVDADGECVEEGYAKPPTEL
jgi:hypothetical protein